MITIDFKTIGKIVNIVLLRMKEIIDVVRKINTCS